MSFKKEAWAGVLVALLAVGARDARAAVFRFDVLRQYTWEPFLGFTPGPEAGPDYSLKVFDQAGTLQWSSISGAGFNNGTLRSATFEDLRSLALRVEYKPTSSAQTSVYQLTLDAPDWSTASLPAPRPSISASTLQAGQTLSVTWPVYPQGNADVHAYVLPSSGPFKILYDQRPAYAAGGAVTGPLPEGYGYVELDYYQPMPGAATSLQLQSGPDAGLQPAADVQYLSWQGAGFTVVPEPTALAGVALVLPLLRRRHHPRRA